MREAVQARSRQPEAAVSNENPDNDGEKTMLPGLSDEARQTIPESNRDQPKLMQQRQRLALSEDSLCQFLRTFTPCLQEGNSADPEICRCLVFFDCIKFGTGFTQRFWC
ncbi:MAG: hypothetical protein DMG97_17725 [Acidobacteria bacterium]|nr:MAG: hypothetical protein DMG97_17725 [Acidobacteriota bacterium]PYV76426.1 MAG: hypothetical protein DMG96_13940 [Acidobacteriota bacterium]